MFACETVQHRRNNPVDPDSTKNERHVLVQKVAASMQFVFRSIFC